MKPQIHPQALVETQEIGEGTRIWAFAHVMKGTLIGADCNIGDHCYIEGKSAIGNRVTVKNGVSIWEGVHVEDDVFIGPNAAFTNVRLPISRNHENFEKTFVRKGACIGANATIVCGLSIGQYAFIGAGAVVTADIGDYVLAFGNPAEPQGYICACREKLEFSKEQAACACGLRFRLTNGKVSRL